MLYLSRRAGEGVFVGDDVEITVDSINKLPNGDFKVSLGFTAPRHIAIDRTEIREQRINNIDRVFNGYNQQSTED